MIPQRPSQERIRPNSFYITMGGVLMVVSALLLAAALTYDSQAGDDGTETATGSVPTGSSPDTTTGGSDGSGAEAGDAGDSGSSTSSTVTSPTLPFDGWVNPASVGEPYGDDVEGLLTFRGNPTRTYYGRGPVPDDPEILWSYPSTGGMCGLSSNATWCGTGWTGQPAVWEQDGSTWVAFGAYDKAVHWLDGDSGEEVLDSFPVDDIIKGTVTVDPDGFPLLYTGSRDSYFRIIAMDRDQPTELWKLSSEAVAPTLWNNDWDGSALVLDDYLFEGGENSQFHIVKLNRAYDEQGDVTVDPLVFNTPGWDDELLRDLGDDEVSIENSVAISGNTVYFGNSGGLIQGWDISGLESGETPERVFRYWAGEDTDASVVIDAEGMLYVGVESEKGRARAQEVGQLIKLDPTVPEGEDPLVWSIADPGGVWATPALHGDMLYAAFDQGRVIGVETDTGDIVWEKQFGNQTWQSPVVIDDVLIQGDCDGELSAYDVSDPTIDPPLLWTVVLPGCIESTPAVWDGVIYVGTRAGQFHAVG